MSNHTISFNTTPDCITVKNEVNIMSADFQDFHITGSFGDIIHFVNTGSGNGL